MLSEQDMVFESLYRAHYGSLYAYARAQLSDPFEIEEIIQDTFYTAAQKQEAFENHENPKAFLLTILKFKIREHIRSRNRYLNLFLSLSYDPLLNLPAPSNPYPISIPGIMETVQETLTEEEFKLFLLFLSNGGSHLKISKEFGISVWASQKRLERIRGKLRDVLPED